MAPETARVEAGELLKQLPWPRMIIDGHLVKDGDLAHTRWQTATADGREVLAGVAVFGWQPSDGARFELWDRDDPGDKLTLDGEDLDAEVRAALNVEGVHELWRDADPQPRHPLAPLVRAWWKWPVEVEDRNDRRAGNLFSPAVWTATQESGQFDFFPGFGPGAGRLLRRPAGQAPGAVARSVGVVRLYIEVFYAIRRSARLRP